MTFVLIVLISFNPGLSAVFEQDFVYQAVINVLDLLDCIFIPR